MRTCIAIDLKSFYASVECVERGLDPLTTNLVVADTSRTEKTICLAVTPSLKQYGISGRARLFEVNARVKEINEGRKLNLNGNEFSGKSHQDPELKADPSLELDFIAATPRMHFYMEYSARIYQIYLRYVSAEDIHVYSVDEIFCDVTDYLAVCHMSGHDLAKEMIRTVYEETGITATAGVGTNLYLAKIAMDIVAKHIPEDEDGVRIAELDEHSYRKLLWDHKPITDFWRVGRGYAKRLARLGLYTMGDVAACSAGRENDYFNEDLLFKTFGINAELLIDHAWGNEPCTIAEIKAYRPKSNSVSSGQVLKSPYSYEKGELIVTEMTDLLALDLVEKGLVTDQLVLYVGYDIENLTDKTISREYKGEVVTDWYGRRTPAPATGSENLSRKTSSSRLLMEAIRCLYRRIADPLLLIRRVNITANHVVPADIPEEEKKEEYVQLELFRDYEAEEEQRREEDRALEKEHKMQEAVIRLQKKYGKNAVLKGMNLQEGGQTRERNEQVGGHKA